ncbi:MAG TPA: G1 family glutamic endopeptidase [Thermoplasmata archaeon]|nr:G1 family glutamic endopeptidase [Thermoplasmata archaeon]
MRGDIDLRRGARFGATLSLLLAGILLLPTRALAAPSALTSCSNGPGRPPTGAPNGSNCLVTVLVQIPTGAGGLSLAQVEFNGTLFPNGSLIPNLITGVNYTFTAVDISPGYGFDQWAVSNGNISNITSVTSQVSFPCLMIPSCPQVNLSLSLASQNHSLFSGQAFHANAANSMNATLTVPTVSWWHNPWNTAPPPSGAAEVVDWGVGLGGILGGDSTLLVGLQINYSATRIQGVFNSTYTPFWSTTLRNQSGQRNFTANATVLPGDSIALSVSCSAGPFISDTTRHWSYSAGFSPNCKPGGVVFTTGEWIAWDPEHGSGVLAENYTHGNGTFQNIVFNGRSTYPNVPALWTPPCSPYLRAVPPCTSSYPAHVQFTEWIVDTTNLQSYGSWGEVLNPGFLFYPISNPPQSSYSAHFEPNVTNQASFEVSVFPIPTDPFNSSLLPEAVVNGNAYGNDEIGYLPQHAVAPLSMIGSWTDLGFGRWGNKNLSGPGLLLSNPSVEASQVQVNGPGYLELLPIMTSSSPFPSLLQGPAISGYAVDPYDKLELYGPPQAVTGTIVVPSVSLNSNFTGIQQLMTASVGLFGNYAPGSGVNQSVLQTGIAVRGNWAPRQNISYQVWFRYVGTGGPDWSNSSFNVHAGDRLFMEAAEGFGGTYCPGNPAKAYVCWNVTDLNLSERWNGSDTIGSELYTGFLFSMWGVSNGFPLGVPLPIGWPASGHLPSFGQLSFIAHGLYGSSTKAPTYMFGPYLATSASYYSGLSQVLSPSLVASPVVYGFNVAQA